MSRLLACVILLLSTGCSGRNATSAVAKILSIQENRSLESSPPAPAPPLENSRYLRAGDLWRVPSGYQATVAFSPGVMATVLNGGELRIKKFRLAKDGNETADDFTDREIELEFLAGSAVLWVAAAGLTSSLRIVTDLGTISAKADSLFYLEKSGQGIHLTCVRGTLLLANSKGTLTTIPPGKWTERRADGREPGDPQAASANPAIQEEIATSLERETAMQALVLAERKTAPSWRRP